MKNSIKKILALCVAMVMSTVCLCTAVSAEELSTAASFVNAAADEHTESIESAMATYVGTYSNGSSFITLRNDGTCYFHIVYTNSMYVRANGTYAVSGNNFAATLNGYMVVDSSGIMQDSSSATLGVDGLFSNLKKTLTIESISYDKD